MPTLGPCPGGVTIEWGRPLYGSSYFMIKWVIDNGDVNKVPWAQSGSRSIVRGVKYT